MAAKRLIGHEFRTARTTEPGINAGPVDLLLLRANSLVNAWHPVERWLRLIEENSQIGGWLIFYTHDVQDSPTEFGCTPSYLEAVVAKAASHSELVTVGEAMRRLQVKPVGDAQIL